MTMTGTELSLLTMMMMTILVPPLLLCDKPKTNFEFLFQSVLMTKCDDYIADGGNGSNDHLSNAIYKEKMKQAGSSTWMRKMARV